MKVTVEAVFEDRAFKPVEHPRNPEGQSVQITVETIGRFSPEDSLELASRVYRGLPAEEIDEIERIALDREHFITGARS